MRNWVQAKIVNIGPVMKKTKGKVDEDGMPICLPEDRNFLVEFNSSDGSRITTFVSQEEIDLERKLARISLIVKFNRIAHIRLPDGTHVHVSNKILVQE